jgi:uncharacterized protein YgbK (DUF1537 family)
MRIPLDETPLIYATAEPDAVAAAQARLGVAQAGRYVEDALADLAVAARKAGRRRFVVAGGETSGAVTAALASRGSISGPRSRRACPGPLP